MLLKELLKKIDTRDLNWTNIQRILALFITVVIVAHLCACAFFSLSAYIGARDACEGSELETFWNVEATPHENASFIDYWTAPSTFSDATKSSWAEIDGLVEITCVVNFSSNKTVGSFKSVEEPFFQYFRAAYWAVITMVTTGFGDIVPQNGEESFLACLVVYVGLLLTLAMIANITALITDLEESKSEHDKKLDMVSAYIATQDVPETLKQNVRHYYQYKWESLHGFEPESEFSHFPHPIRAQVIGARSQQLLQNIEFLRQCPNRAFITAVLETVALEVVLPNDVVVKNGTQQRDALCLCQGECAKFDSAMRCVIQSFDGKDTPVIGATCVLVPERYKGNLRAKTFCEFIVLRGSRFHNLQQEYLSLSEIEQMSEVGKKSARRAKKMDKLFGLSDNGASRKSSGPCARCQTVLQKSAAPASNMRHIMHGCLAFGAAWYALVVPLMAAFSFSTCPVELADAANETASMNDTYHFEQSASHDIADEAMLAVYAIGAVWDLLFAADVLLRWRFYNFLRNGVSISAPRLIARKYCSNRFKVAMDIVGATPWHLLSLYLGIHWFFPLRMIKLLWLLNFGSHAREVISALSLKLNFIVTSTARRFASLIMLVVLSSHIIGCGWVFVGFYSGCALSPSYNAAIRFVNDTVVEPVNWIEADRLNSEFHFDQTSAFVYMRSFYWALVAMTTVGYGDIRAHNIYETVYATFALLFGGLIYPAIVGAVAVLLTSLNATTAAFRAKMQVIRTYMERQRLPAGLKMQINSYFDYLWCSHNGIEADTILKDLPPSLRKQLYCTINRPALRAMRMFSCCSSEFCNGIMSNMRSVVYLPADLIIQIHEKAEHMYFVSQGIVRVLNADETLILSILGNGDSFGETALLPSIQSTGDDVTAVRRTANVRALTYCNCVTLANSAFKAVLEDWPSDKKTILRNINLQFAIKKRQNDCVMGNFRRYRKLHSVASLDTELVTGLAGIKRVQAQSFRHHDSNWQHFWRTLQMLGAVYNVIVIPARISFDELIPASWFFVDALFDALAITDMCLKDRLITFMDRGQIHSSPREVRCE